MTRAPSWVSSPPGTSHGLHQPGEGGHRGVCGLEGVQGDRAGNRQERREKKQCLRGDTWLFVSALLQGASSTPFSPGKASPCWLWPLWCHHGSLIPMELLSLAADGGCGVGSTGVGSFCPCHGAVKAGSIPVVRRRKGFWHLSDDFWAGQPGCPIPSCAKLRPCSLPSPSPGASLELRLC